MITEKRRLWKLLLFTIPTLGIYNIYFWFRFTQDLNDMNREEKKIKNYILVLFLSIITLGIYRWVWLFYLEDRLQITGEQMGVKVHPGPGTTLFLWTFGRFILIGPLIADFCIIHNMNKLAVEYNAGIAKNTKVLNKNDSLTSNKDKKAAAKAASGKSGKTSDKKPSKTEKTPEKMSAGAAAINARAAAKMAAEAAAAKAAAETATSASIAKTAVSASGRAGSPASTMNRTTKTTAKKQKVVNKQVITPETNPKVVNKQVFTPDADFKAAQKKAADTSSTAKTETSSAKKAGTVSLDVEKNRPRADSSTLTVNPGLNNMPTSNKK